MDAKYNSLPPSNFESLAAVLCSFKDEIAALKEEVAQLRQLNVDSVSSNADNTCLKHICDMKLMLQDLSYLKKSWRKIMKKRLTQKLLEPGHHWIA